MPGKHNGRKRARGDDDVPPPGESTPPTNLNNSIQKILKRTLTQGELAYTVKKVDGGWLASVTTPKMSDTFDAQEHSGEIKDTEKEAKEHAASTALSNIFADPELLSIHDTPRPIQDMGEKPPPDAPKEKGKFKNAVLKICRISLKKGDITYETNEVEGGGWQSTVTASCLPGEWKDMNFVGEVCQDEVTAEHSAATVGYQKLMADPEMVSLHDKKKFQNQQSKGKGKGAMMPMMPDFNPMMMMMCMGMPGMMQHMQNMMGGGEPMTKRQRRN